MRPEITILLEANFEVRASIHNFAKNIAKIKDGMVIHSDGAKLFLEKCTKYENWIEKSYGIRINSEFDLTRIMPPALLCREKERELDWLLITSVDDGNITFINSDADVQTTSVDSFRKRCNAFTLVIEKFFLDKPTDKNLASRLDDLSFNRTEFLEINSADQTKEELVSSGLPVFQKHKVLLIKNLFSKSLLGKIRTELKTVIESTDPKQTVETGAKRNLYPVEVAEAFNDPALYANEKLLPVLNQILEPGLILNNVVCVSAEQGSDIQNIHADHPELFAEDRGDLNRPAYAVVVALPMCPVNFFNGTTRFFMPDHLDAYEISRNFVAADQVQIDADIGDCIIYDFRIIHQGLPTIKNFQRNILYLVYSRPWFQEVTKYRAKIRTYINQEELKKVPDIYKPLFRQSKLQVV